jgi:hypothetical protein
MENYVKWKRRRKGSSYGREKYDLWGERYFGKKNNWWDNM